MAERTDNVRLGMELARAIDLGRREWIPKRWSREWGDWMRRVGLADITQVDLDTLAQMFHQRQLLRQISEEGLHSVAAMKAFNEATARFLALARSLRLTRQAVDKKRLLDALPTEGGLEPEDLTVTKTKRAGAPHEW